MRERFENQRLYDMALTHSSWKRSAEDVDYERLEFLGDAVLQLFVTEMLYARFPDWKAGDLTKLRQRLVNEDTLARLASRMGLGAQARLGKGEETTGGRERPALLADLFEAVLGALYLDQGEPAARELVAQQLGPELDLYAESLTPATTLGDVQNPKNQLQEFTQDPRRALGTPTYELVERVGPEHQSVFRVAVSVGARVIATGEGSSLKRAETAAAGEALRRLIAAEAGE